MSATVQRAGAETPSRLLLSPQTAALRRIIELREQRDRYAAQVAAAEAAAVQARAAAPLGQRTASRSAAIDRAADEAHRLSVSARTATRIVEEAEADYGYLFGEPVPELKVCAACNQPKPIDAFPVHSTTGNPRGYCRACWNARQRADYHQNRETRRAYLRDHFHKHYDRLRPRYTAQARARRQRLKAATAGGN